MSDVGITSFPECKDCDHSEFVYHFEHMDADLYGCKLLGLYDDDARGVGDKCGPEGKLFKQREEKQ